MTVNGVSEKHGVQKSAVKPAQKTAETTTVPMTSKKEKNTKTINKTQQNFENDLKTGKLKQDEVNFKIFGYTVSKKLDSYTYTPAKDETFGTISYRYNLPGGTLRNQALSEGNSGDLNKCTPEGVVYIDGDKIRAGIEISKEKVLNTQH